MKLKAFTTEPFKIDLSLYTRSLTVKLLRQWGLVITTPILALFAIGLYDWRFIVVAFMALMVVYPMTLPIVYINYMLRPEVRAILYRQTVIRHADGGIEVKYHPDEHADISDEETASPLPLRYVPPTLTLPPSMVNGYDIYNGHLRVSLSHPHIHFLFIPLDKIKHNFD